MPDPVALTERAPETDRVERNPAITEDDVRWAYSLFLHRAPETREVIDTWIGTANDLRSFAAEVATSREARVIAGLNALTSSDHILFHRTRFNFLQPIALNLPLMINAYVIQNYEMAESDFIAGTLRPGACAIDLGARHGWFTGIMAKAVGPTGRVFAFEPDGVAFLCEALIRENGFGQVTLIRKAASDRSGSIKFDNVAAAFDNAGSSVVATVRLDDVLKDRPSPVRCVKIDIEGAEYLALKGAAEIIRTDKPVILIELNEAQQRRVSRVSAIEPLRLLRSAGYAIASLDGTPLGDEKLQAMIGDGGIHNVVARPEEHG